MKRITSILLLLIGCVAASMAGIHTYSNHSVLQSGKWVKIRVQESGICQLTYEELQEMGLDPHTVVVYGYGGSMLSQDFSQPRVADDLCQVPVCLSKGSDGVFGKGDRLLFYAQGINKWTYTGTRFAHTGDTYATYGCYFLTSDPNKKQDAEVISAGNEADYEVHTYTDCQVYEVDTVNLVDPTGKAGGGREFYSDPISPGKTFTLRFSTPNAIADDELIVTASIALTGTNAASFTMKQGENQRSLSFTEWKSRKNEEKARTAETQWKTKAEANEQKIVCSLTCSNAFSAAYLNYVEVNVQSRLAMVGGELTFCNTQHIGAMGNSRYFLEGATDETVVWNVTDLSHIYAVPTTRTATGLTFIVTNEEPQTFVAFNPSATFRKPARFTEGYSNKDKDKAPLFKPVANQNLHALHDIEYVVLCHPDFTEAANRLAAIHSEIDGMTTAVVTSEQVYNEFSSGKPDATAYRWLMKMLYDKADATNGVHPRFLTLMGDGTYDNRKVYATSGPNTLLTYQAVNSVSEINAYATDDYFAFFSENESLSDREAKMYIGVGRLPVSTADEAMSVVDKIDRYIHNADHSKWRQQLIFLADDGDHNMHTRDADRSAENVRVNNPSFVTNKIFLDAYTQQTTASGEQYPLAQDRLHKLLQSGALFMNYAGHGGYNNITSEQVLTRAQIRTMKISNPAFWMLATCNFLSFDAGERSAGEDALLASDGGAIGVMSSCRTVYASNNAILNKHFCDALFAHDDPCGYEMTIGDAARLAKNATGNDQNKLPYILLGDPGMRLNYPTQLEVKLIAPTDTLSALSERRLEGYLAETDRTVADWFEGVVQLSLYDKLQQITCNDNDESDEKKKSRYTYNDYPNLLFSGSAEVKQGRFAIDMMIPLDIRYNYDNGRIVMYAYDVVADVEAIGHSEEFIIGGSSKTEIIDTIGPEIRMYINTPSFVDGGRTHANPRLYAQLHDIHGINTAGIGIGHDLLLTIDDDLSQTYVLNELYTAATGSYQEGTLTYQLTHIPEGKHHITLRAWDLMNNSSTSSLHFEVDTTANPVITEAVLYPSPARMSDRVTLRFATDQPDAIYTVTLRLYDWSGRLVSETTQRSGETIAWNVSDLCVNSGLYFYQVLMEGNTGRSKKSGKLLIEGE